MQLPLSSWLKASRTGTTRTLTWITRICSHTYINTVRTTLCQAPAQLLQIDRYITFFNAKVMSGRLKRYQYITSMKQQVTLFAQGHRLSACSDQLTVCLSVCLFACMSVCLPVCLPACMSVRLLRCQRHVCRQFPHCLFVLSRYKKLLYFNLLCVLTEIMSGFIFVSCVVPPGGFRKL